MQCRSTASSVALCAAAQSVLRKVFLPHAPRLPVLPPSSSSDVAKIPSVTLSGPMSFGASIRKTMELCRASKPMEFTICIILCDGEPNNQADTFKAIAEASALPIAIVAIGVGDGPWSLMHAFDDNVPSSKFDNFNFVELNAVVKKAKDDGKSLAATLARECLEEIPAAFAAATKLNLFKKW